MNAASKGKFLKYAKTRISLANNRISASSRKSPPAEITKRSRRDAVFAEVCMRAQSTMAREGNQRATSVPSCARRNYHKHLSVVLIVTHVTTSRLLRRPSRGRAVHRDPVWLFLARVSQAHPRSLGASVGDDVHHALRRGAHHRALECQHRQPYRVRAAHCVGVHFRRRVPQRGVDALWRL